MEMQKQIIGTPIASKDLGINSETGLKEIIKVWSINIDSQAEKVLCIYQIETISPTGKVVSLSPVKVFERYNRPAQIQDGVEIKPANMKFDALRSSQVGQMITGMIALDLADIKSIETLEQDLTQL